MKRSLRTTSALALLTLAACSVRSKAPQNNGIAVDDTSAAPPIEAGAIDGDEKPDPNVADAEVADTDVADADVPDAEVADTDVGDADVADTEAADAGPPSANIPRARGFYVFNLEYNSSLNIGALGIDGSIKSVSLLSSGSDLPGLSLPLGTDAVPPTQVQSGDDLVIVDRNNNAIDWVGLSAKVTNQVGVGPGGFASNPYDYLQLSPELGFVTRFATNGAPGNAELDEGGDLLAINPRTGKLLGRVDFNYLTQEVSDLQPRPNKLIAYDGNIYVVLGMLAGTDFSPLADSVLARVNPETLQITATLGLGLRNCEDMSIAPGGRFLAIACHGGWADDPITLNSGIVVVDATTAQPEIAATYGATELANAQISTLSFASDTLVMFSSYGSSYPTALPDRAFALDLTDGSVSEPVFEAGAFQLGSIRCAAEQNVCVLANADAFAVEFFDVSESGIEHDQTVEFDANLGLPPRYIGVY